MDNTPVVQATNTPIEPTLPPSSNNYLKFIIAGLIILFIGLFGGYYLMKSSSKPPPKVCTMEAKLCPDGTSVGRTGPNCEFAPCPQITTAQPSPTPNPTANWKTYINTIDKFSFKYPMNWKVTTEGGSDPEKSDIIAINDNCNYETGEVCINIDVSYIPAPDYKEGQNISDYFDTYIKKIDRKDSQKIRVDNVDALLTLSSIQNYGQSWENPFYILETIQNKKALWMTYSEQAKKKQPDLKYKQTFDQILSTFKFLDRNETDDIPEVQVGYTTASLHSGKQSFELEIWVPDNKSRPVKADILNFPGVVLKSYNIEGPWASAGCFEGKKVYKTIGTMDQIPGFKSTQISFVDQNGQPRIIKRDLNGDCEPGVVRKE